MFAKYQKLATCYPNSGNSVLFWSDKWTDLALKDKYPQLLSFARKLKCSIRFFIEQGEDRLFSLPLSQQAATQLMEIQTLIQSRVWDEDVNDIWSYIWGSARFSSKRAYGSLIGTTAASPLFKWLWGSSNLGKHKFFFWLLRDRLNTRYILKRKNMHLDDYNCVLCNLDVKKQVSISSLSAHSVETAALLFL